MPHSMKCSVVKVGNKKSAAPLAKAKVGDPPPTSLQLLDTQKGGFTMVAVNSAGNPVDVSAVATLTPEPVSSDTSVLTCGPPTGMHEPCVGVKAGPVTVSVTVTWNDGSIGPFPYSVPGNVATDPTPGGGFVAEFDTPVPK